MQKQHICIVFEHENNPSDEDASDIATEAIHIQPQPPHSQGVQPYQQLKVICQCNVYYLFTCNCIICSLQTPIYSWS